MKSFKAIAAMSLNRVIGAGNKIPWHLPEDFKWFKQMTTSHIIVMGRKTFESIGRPLPNRTTVVLSRGQFSFPGVRVIHSLHELAQNVPSPHYSQNSPHPSCGPPLPLGWEAEQREGPATDFHGVGRAKVHGGCPSDGERTGVKGDLNCVPDIFICGGAQIYVQALPQCSDLFLTLVKREVEGDAFFPPFEDLFDLADEIRDCPEFKILHYRNRTLKR